MNFNASGPRYPPGRKLSKRPTDAPGLDNTRNFSPPPPAYNPYEDNQQYNHGTIPPYQQNQPYIQPNSYGGYPGEYPGPGNNAVYGMPQPAPTGPGMTMPTQLFSDPLVANVAMTYGSKIMDSGKELVDREIEKYVPVTRLKYYFAVDTAYVLQKLKLLFFPFTHADWSIKYELNAPIQPRYEVNAPDLYIPTMAYVTYVLVAGMALGTQNRFTPEVLGMLASSAIAWTVVEILVALVTLYIINIQTNLKTLDLIAYSGYKYVGIIVAVLMSIVLNKTGYYIGLVYSGFSLSSFMLRSLRWQVLAKVTTSNDTYDSQISLGHKRRMYFLVCMVCVQPALMWWLSFHLVPPPLPPIPPNLLQS